MKRIIIIIIFWTGVNCFAQEVNITNRNYFESDDSHEMNVIYPQIDFGPNALMGIRGVAGDINSAIDTLVFKQVHIFKTWMNESNEKKSGINGKHALKISYDTVYYTSNFFSFRFHVFSSPAIAAHPYTYDVSFNYCPTSVGLLKISDLFLTNSGYLQYISNKCILSLKLEALP